MDAKKFFRNETKSKGLGAWSGDGAGGYVVSGDLHEYRLLEVGDHMRAKWRLLVDGRSTGKESSDLNWLKREVAKMDP